MALEQHETEKKAREAAGPVPDPDAVAPDEKALDAVIATTTKELGEKQKQYAQLRETIAAHDRQMKDGAYRRSLLRRQRDKAEEETAELTADVQSADHDWRAKRAALGEEQRRGKAALLKTAAMSVGLLILYTVIALLLYQNFDVEARLLVKIGGWILAGEILCAIFVGIRVGLSWQAAKARLYLAAQRKHSVSLSIAEKHGEAFRAVYDFGLHCASIDWATQFRHVGEKLREDLRAFSTALQDLYDMERKAYDKVQFAQTLFRRSVVAPSELEQFVGGAGRYDAEKNHFKTAHPLSGSSRRSLSRA